MYNTVYTPAIVLQYESKDVSEQKRDHQTYCHSHSNKVSLQYGFSHASEVLTGQGTSCDRNYSNIYALLLKETKKGYKFWYELEKSDLMLYITSI